MRDPGVQALEFDVGLAVSRLVPAPAVSVEWVSLPESALDSVRGGDPPRLESPVVAEADVSVSSVARLEVVGEGGGALTFPATGLAPLPEALSLSTEVVSSFWIEDSFAGVVGLTLLGFFALVGLKKEWLVGAGLALRIAGFLLGGGCL